MNNNQYRFIYIASLVLVVVLLLTLAGQFILIHYQINLAVCILILSILIFQGIFIFRPLYLKTNVFTTEINAKNEVLNNINKQLEITNSKLNESQNLFAELSEHVPGTIYQFELFDDGNSRFNYASDGIKNIYELTAEEALADKNKVFARVYKPDFEAFYKSIILSKENLSDWTHDYRVDLPIKGIRWLRGESVPKRTLNSIIWYGYIRDITEQKVLEQQLKLSEEQFRGVFEHSAIGVALVNPNGTWKEVNNSLCSFLGYTRDELIGMSFTEITHPDDIEIGKQNMQDLIDGKSQTLLYEKRYIHKNGEFIWAMLAGSVVRDSAGNLIHLVAQIKDVSERKIADAKLNRTLSNLQGILDASTHVAIIGIDLNGTINLFNRGAENLIGYRAHELLDIATPAIYHDQNEIEARRLLLSKKFDREFSAMDVFTDVARRGKFQSREWTFIRKDGSLFPAQLIITAIKNEHKEITGFLGVAADISKIKEKEKELNDLVDVTSEQNKRLINFAHIVSHNLRSHSGNFSLLLGIYDNETDEKEKLEILKLLKRASVQLSDTVTNLNEVVVIAANLNEKKEPLNLLTEIKRVEDTLSGVLHENKVEIINNVGNDVVLKVVPAYMESILLNFFTNAVKYSSPNRTPKITLSTFLQNHYTVLQIEDNGVGIDLKLHAHKLFGMYKTFHGNKDARGIGLFITKNQIEAMRGKIEVESQLDKGTIFKIFFNNNN